jgi:hypothetical protein
MFSGWENSGRFFPEPNLVENKVYACRDDDGFEFEARFCFGEGEFWWTDPRTNREVTVTAFSRGKAKP